HTPDPRGLPDLRDPPACARAPWPMRATAGKPDRPALPDRLPFERQRFNRAQRFVSCESRMERGHRHVTVADCLIVRSVVRLPRVLPFLDPVVRPALRIVALGD